jgi:pyruvate,water dikinase
MIVSFERLTPESARVAGGKGASLARLAAAGFPVPPGFVVCASAFDAFLERHAGRELAIRSTNGLDVHDAAALDAVSGQLRRVVLENPLPDETHDAIRRAYRALSGRRGALRVAVRSSAIGEDGASASFAGQHESFLNVCGEEAVARAVQECWASCFTPRAMFYRAQRGRLPDARMAVVVQEMVLSEKSGILFTIDPVRKRRDCMVIEAVFGLGEGAVSGAITPDHYVVARVTGALREEVICLQSTAIEYDMDTGGTRHVALSPETGAGRVLNETELRDLRSLGLRLEAFFGAPQDVEWGIARGELQLLQSRPITA